MTERPKCDLGHELDFIGHNHVEPDHLREHVAPGDDVGLASIERTISARKAFIQKFWEDRGVKQPTA